MSEQVTNITMDEPAGHTPEASAPWAKLDAFRLEIRRFAKDFADLPVETKATCPGCREVRHARFIRSGQQVLLEFDCPACDNPSVVHHDAIWTELPPDLPGSATQTLHGSRIRPVIRRLPRTIETLCPECSGIIVGRHFVQDGKVLTEKTCPEHGYFRDLISPDVRLYAKASWWSFEEHAGQAHPQRTGGQNCPSDCGLCNQHLSSPCLSQIDLTNRCNMKCPICFANANAQGFIWEPGYDEIVRQLCVLRDMRPTPTTAIQFTGGEPTIHPNFLKIVAAARDMGFSYIQIATNGITMADENFARQAAAAGLHTLYLQFDGVGDEPHQPARNYPGIWEKKLAAIENARKTGMKVCLVPTVIKNVNDDQVPEILQFAIDNIDVVSGISFQPVSFTGRISTEELETHRYTLGDLAIDLGKYPGVEPMRDMFPLSLVVPISNLLEAVTGEPKIRSSCHPDCAFGTYFLVSPEGKAYPFPTVIDVEGMFCDMNRHAQRIKRKGRKANWLDRLRIYFMFKKHWRKDTAPPDLSVKRFVRTLLGMVDKSVGRGESGKANYRSLLCAGMHFQDRYNYDVERVKRCIILYSTPAGVFPFCSHNCGPEFRHLSQAGFLEVAKDNETE
ncbi:MAG: radical SAM protein [Phycisphaerae bacterium]|nr:radical SAM protein [Phycisphaerae bacterium]